MSRGLVGAKALVGMMALAGVAATAAPPIVNARTATLDPPAATVASPPPEVLFARRCGVCHNAGGVGAQTLARRLGPDRAVLAQRADLTVSFVTVVVRHGLLNMPRLTRVEVTDEELAAIATWLARPRKEQNP